MAAMDLKPAAKQATPPRLGLDARDGEKRITRGREFLLVGGSKDTHHEMTERALKVNEELDRRGKRLADVASPGEMRDRREGLALTPRDGCSGRMRA
jgi:hypothetical protein